MSKIFTPNEAAALIEISPKRIYKEIEYRIIRSDAFNHHQLSFGTLVYLRALKEIDFDFSVSYRIKLHEELQNAWNQQVSTLEFGRFFSLNISEIVQELQILIDRFEDWKAKLVNNPNILGGEIVFPGSRLSVKRVGGCLERGESLELLQEDYPYLTNEDFDFARIYFRAYPVQGRPRLDEVYNL
jgi:uncharacterized protein (DUF433 family)